MPNRIPMFISNGRPTLNQIKTFTANTPSVTTRPTVLNAPMITRIHNVQPGCNSCGRH